MRVLLALASGKFEIFITTDQRLSYQQAVQKFSIGVIVLIAKRNKLKFLQPLVRLRDAACDEGERAVRQVMEMG